jgi:hypothetical protein
MGAEIRELYLGHRGRADPPGNRREIVGHGVHRLIIRRRSAPVQITATELHITAMKAIAVSSIFWMMIKWQEHRRKSA